MSLPLVSIIIPTYNQQEVFLRECIQSAVNQSYSNIEVVICNNWSSNEDVDKVLKEFIMHPNVKIVKPPSHLSMIDNFGFAADQANGEYISFLSSDDLLEPKCIELLVELINLYPDITFAFGNIECIDAFTEKHIVYQRDGTYREGYYTTKEFLNSFVYLKDVWMNGDIIRKDKYDEIGGIGYFPIRYAYDMTLALRLLVAGGTVGYINQILGKVRIWPIDKVEEKIVKFNLLIEIHDIIENYNIVLNDEHLLGLLDGGKKKLLKIRKDKLQKKIKYACICYIKGYINENIMLEIKNIVNNNLSDYKVNLYLLCCKSPFKQFLSLIINLKLFTKREPAQ